MRTIKIKSGNFVFVDKFDLIFEKVITPFGSGAKIDAPKKYIGRKVYVILRKDNSKTLKGC